MEDSARDIAERLRHEGSLTGVLALMDVWRASSKESHARLAWSHDMTWVGVLDNDEFAKEGNVWTSGGEPLDWVDTWRLEDCVEVACKRMDSDALEAVKYGVLVQAHGRLLVNVLMALGRSEDDAVRFLHSLGQTAHDDKSGVVVEQCINGAPRGSVAAALRKILQHRHGMPVLGFRQATGQEAAVELQADTLVARWIAIAAEAVVA